MKRVLKYSFRGTFIKISTSGKLNLSSIIKRSLSRKGYDLNEFIYEKGYDMEKCRICKTHYPPFKINCHEENGFIIIDGFEPTREKVYCYGLNNECPGISMNSNSVEFISKTLLLSDEDALKYIKDNNSSTFYKENWDDIEEYKKSQRRDVEYFRYKYDNWEVKYNEYKNKLSKSNSLERYIDEYGEVNGRKIFHEISTRKDSMSFNFFLSKNNNNYEKAKFEYNERLKSVSVNLDGFIRRYGPSGKLKYDELNKRRSEIQKSYISTLTPKERSYKYGITIEKIGLEKYNKWRESILVPITRASKESSNIFNGVLEEIDYNPDDVYVGIGDSKEFFLIDDNNQIFFYDFVIRSKKILIEYNGVAFHPKLENIENFKPIYTKLKPIEIYNKQEYKMELAISRGFKVLQIWSDEDNKLEKCLSFIKNNIEE